MPILPYLNHSPNIDPSAWIAPDAWVTGKVSIGKNASLFFHAMIRGDVQAVEIGEGTNIQDGAMLHTSHHQPACIVGNYVTIGHHAIIHSCTVGDDTIIGMGATILDQAVIGKHCLIGAQSLVPMGMQIPEGHLALGVPAKIIRKLTPKEIEGLRVSAEDYIEVSQNYKKYFETKQAPAR